MCSGSPRWSCPYLALGAVEARVDTRVSFVQNSREFHAKRVSYFAKNAPCFAKFRVSQNWLKHAKKSFVCFVFFETEYLAYKTKRNFKLERTNCSLTKNCRLLKAGTSSMVVS